MINNEINEILDLYEFDKSKYIGIKNINYGHINSTYILYFDFKSKVKRYLLQQINSNVFKDVGLLMENIENVTNYGKNMLKAFGVNNYKNKILRIFKTTSNKSYIKTSNNNYYRIYHYIEGGISYETSNNKEIFYNAGKAIGFFQNMLAFYPVSKLNETIKHFHDTPFRYNTFLNILNNADENTIKTCQNEIDFFIDNYQISKLIQPLLDNNIMPKRVIHNDTKLNNIMFDYVSNKELCLVDLDTVMPGSICYDFGDFIRSGCNMAKEDEKDLTKVIFNKDLFIKFAEGYISNVFTSIKEIELNNLVNGAIVMCYECGMRFLSDYLDGNKYFKIDYKTHNLIRCKTQIKMCEQLIENKKELEEIIANIYKSLHNNN